MKKPTASKKKATAEKPAFEVGDPYPLVTVTLSQEASDALHLYRNKTGRELVDIASGVLAAEVNNVNEQLETLVAARDDSPEIMVEQIDTAGHLRLMREREAGYQTGASPAADEMPRKHVVTLELSDGAHAALVVLKEYEEHASIEDAILETVMRMGVQSLFQQVLGQENDPTMAKWFGLYEDEQER